ncbi:hypothetical protein LWI28_021137 [Acer negundo]|uniref:Uncharacterized protein n=1 Tax=Acer negundo TaxID=4023 RepID=A0AAD5P676_ACENE|nr:hypothetical protein LWI28_021137 [Acer negundo]
MAILPMDVDPQIPIPSVMLKRTIPNPSETFKTEARLPWSGQYKTIKDDNDLQQVFDMFKVRGIETVRIDIKLLPLVVVPIVEIDGTEPPIESLFSSINGSPSMRTYSKDFIFISIDDEDSEVVNSEMFASEDDEDYISL